MSRTANQGDYIHAVRPWSGSRSADGRPKHYEIKPVDEMSREKLRKSLCEAGPKHCKRCQLCEYGKAYIRRYG